MKTFLAFTLTQICRWPVKALRTIRKLLDKVPVVDILLYWLANVLYLIFDLPLTIINSFIAMTKGEYGSYKKSNAVMLDKKLNVSGQYTWNALFIRRKKTMLYKGVPVEVDHVMSHLKFGNQFSTISDQMGRLNNDSMTAFGHWCKDVMLDTIEDEHCAKAVELNNKALLKRVNELKLLEK